MVLWWRGDAADALLGLGTGRPSTVLGVLLLLLLPPPPPSLLPPPPMPPPDAVLECVRTTVAEVGTLNAFRCIKGVPLPPFSAMCVVCLYVSTWRAACVVRGQEQKKRGWETRQE